MYAADRAPVLLVPHKAGALSLAHICQSVSPCEPFYTRGLSGETGFVGRSTVELAAPAFHHSAPAVELNML